MFTIYHGNDPLSQWFLNATLTHPNMKVNDPVYYATTDGKAYVARAYSSNVDGNEVVLVNVPNILLTMAKPFTARLHQYPEPPTIFHVEAAEKPPRYVYTDNIGQYRPNTMLVTDENANVGWQERTHYMQQDRVNHKYTRVDNDDGTWFIPARPAMIHETYIVGESYWLTFDRTSGSAYDLGYWECRYLQGAKYFGNLAIADPSLPDTGESRLFIMAYGNIQHVGTSALESMVTGLNIAGDATIPRPIPSKYMPCIVSPNQTKYRLVVSDDGVLGTEAVTETRYT